MKILLASQSPYRANLLKRLGVAFTQEAADINENQLNLESPSQLVKRLSCQKAEKLATNHPNHLIIGSDQIAIFDEQVIGKPENFDNAKSQLLAFSNKSVVFESGLCVIDTKQNKQLFRSATIAVKFKPLTETTIERYLNYDKPYDCAGSFKIESLGVALFESVVSDDPTALEGLPLIALCQMFEALGYSVFDFQK